MSRPSGHRPLSWLLAFLLGAGGAWLGQPRQLQAAEPVPSQLQGLVTKFDTVANRHDLALLKSLYSDNFSTVDGLNFAAFEQALQSLWKQYPNIQYQTQIQSWRQEDQQWIAQTQTNIEASTEWQGQPAKFRSVIESEQTFAGEKLVRQKILSEKISLTAGAKPPEVEIRLPQQVKPGQEYDFDVILQEPTGDNLLAGVAFAQGITPTNYTRPAPINLELLQAGGLFKRGKAPSQAAPQWLSAVLVSPEGMTWVTQRLRVEP
ncbi:hypothetical protein [Synechocystis sp. LKSZ1]|uniref:hypothetical protein n=1 Tax=Synechocystis sp. LKSZ1 TaxID=3144951 RepID=UPI00336BC48A